MTKNVIIFLIAAVVFFGLGFGASFFLVRMKCPGAITTGASDEKVARENTFAAGWEAAKERLVETGAVRMPDAGAEITAVNGTIEAISGNKVAVRIIKPLEPLADPELDTRDVVIGDDTEIFRSVKKDQERYKKERDEFYGNEDVLEKINTPDFPAPPDPCLAEKIGADELAAGQKALIEAAGNIKNEKQFTATRIVVQACW